MELTVRRNDPRDDIYYIERAEHDGRRWDEPVDRGVWLCTSARICGAPRGSVPAGHSADVECSAFELMTIHDAIELRGAVRFKRCAIDARADPVIIGSPHNDGGYSAKVTYAEALRLACAIRDLLTQQG